MFTMGLIMMMVYLVSGVNGVVWFVLSQTEPSTAVTHSNDVNDINMKTMKSFLVIMGTVLVTSLIGLAVGDGREDRAGPTAHTLAGVPCCHHPGLFCWRVSQGMHYTRVFI